jgi:hypothetical protein
MAKDRKSFLLRLDPALYEALESWAQQELRSVNGQIEFLLRKAVTVRHRLSLELPAESDPVKPDTPQASGEP